MKGADYADTNRRLRRTIRAGKEDEFFHRVRTELEPLWRQFPHVTAVRVQRTVEHDGDARPIAMILEMDFPDMKAIDDCMASPIRPKSHEATEKVMSLFEGRFYHYVTEATVLSPSQTGGLIAAPTTSLPETSPTRFSRLPGAATAATQTATLLHY